MLTLFKMKYYFLGKDWKKIITFYKALNKLYNTASMYVHLGKSLRKARLLHEKVVHQSCKKLTILCLFDKGQLHYLSIPEAVSQRKWKNSFYFGNMGNDLKVLKIWYYRFTTKNTILIKKPGKYLANF